MARASNPLNEFTPNSQGTIAKLVVRESLVVPDGWVPPGGSVPTNNCDQTEFQWIDHWLLARQMAAVNGGDAKPMGVGPYSLTLAGADASIIPQHGTRRLGVINMHTGSTAGGYVGIGSSATFANADYGFVGGAVELVRLEFDAIVAWQTLSDAVDGYLSTVGLVGNAPGYAAAFEYDERNVNGSNPGNLQKLSVFTMHGGIATRKLLDGTGGAADVDVAAVVWPSTNVYKLGSVMDFVAGEARFYVNNALVYTITTTLPVDHSLGADLEMQKSVGVANSSMSVDYTRMYAKLVTAQNP